MTEKKLTKKNLIALTIIVLILIFSIQNTEITEVKFLFWKLSIYRVFVILGSFIIGIMVGAILMKKRIAQNTKKQLND